MKAEEIKIAAESFRDNVFAVAYNYFKDPHKADDVTQEVFLKLCGTEKEFESAEHMRNWLLRVAVNQCRTASGSAWYKRTVPLEAYAESLEFEAEEESTLFLEVMRLPKMSRSIVHLYYYEDYSTAEIAEILKIKESTVRVRLLRARKKLKERLTNEWDDE